MMREGQSASETSCISSGGLLPDYKASHIAEQIIYLILIPTDEIGPKFYTIRSPNFSKIISPEHTKRLARLKTSVPLNVQV